jgi:hypothetical protein
MSIVDLHFQTEMLPHFEAARAHVEGHEVGRRQCPYRDDVTILSMDMDEAPPGATTMELILERVLDKGSRILRTIYYGADGKQVGATERYGNGGWIQAGTVETVNDSGEAEPVEPAP